MRLEVVGRRAFYQPTGSVSVEQVTQLVASAIAECRARDVGELVANICGLTGYVLGMSDRMFAVQTWAEAAAGRVILALVMPAEAIHPSKFGVLVARRASMVAAVFTTEPDAVAWLDGQPKTQDRGPRTPD